MIKLAFSALIACSLAGFVGFGSGCDRTVKEDTTVKQTPNGTEKRTDKVTEDPNTGQRTHTETVTKDRH